MLTINANAVRGCSYEFFYMKIYHTKVSLHENFQIYSNMIIYKNMVLQQNLFVTLALIISGCM